MAEHYEEDDPEPVFCPTCGSEEHTELGALGNILWLRCRRCGMDFEADSP